MGKQHYFRSDGNGGYSIGKQTALMIAIMTLLIMFLTAILPQVFAYGRLNTRVDNMEELKDILFIHEARLDVIEINRARTDVKIQTIENKIDEIRIDVKTLVANDINLR